MCSIYRCFSRSPNSECAFFDPLRIARLDTQIRFTAVAEHIEEVFSYHESKKYFIAPYLQGYFFFLSIIHTHTYTHYMYMLTCSIYFIFVVTIGFFLSYVRIANLLIFWILQKMMKRNQTNTFLLL